MKIAVVYNHASRDVINASGVANRERIGLETLERIRGALEGVGHKVELIEADKNLIKSLETFMPKTVKGEKPGLVFNVAYGIQGQARYTHVPSILEMVGVPYVASGPMAQTLALDKSITKVMLRDKGISTPDSAILEEPDGALPEMSYPLIVKPKSEAVSYGLRVVHGATELREAARRIFDEFEQPVLIEQYIEGRELNVGLIGNDPVEAFTPVEIDFGKTGPRIYTYEDKSGRAARKVGYVCPPDLHPSLLSDAQVLAKRAFFTLGCRDCARVDMRLDRNGRLFVLEVNSLPGIGKHSSYRVGAENAGLDYDQLIVRLIEVASLRHFGDRSSPKKKPFGISQDGVWTHAVDKRGELETLLEGWVAVSSRTADPVGIQRAIQMSHDSMRKLSLRSVESFSNRRSTWLWETPAGFEGGTLLVAPVDVTLSENVPVQPFRREPEWLHGEGIATSRAALAMIEFALQSLRAAKLLKHIPVGVLYYADEGREARYSGSVIREAAEKAKRVLVLDPVPRADVLATERPGQSKYVFRREASAGWLGDDDEAPTLVETSIEELRRVVRRMSRPPDESVRILDIETERFPALEPYRVAATLLLRYRKRSRARAAEERMRLLLERAQHPGEIRLISERPPIPRRSANQRLGRQIVRLAELVGLELHCVELRAPSIAGVVPARTACVSGLGPLGLDFGSPSEAVNRLSLTERALVLVRVLSEDPAAIEAAADGPRPAGSRARASEVTM